ncbi:hypothetical protein BU26DRAFT_512895 [Trematosphaeria pertusa]|uniref:ABM domain-containing protein n=1 Tax=Trematosphaeria pertusa TaxID=390896 RepID=A0A6A6IZG6_9PLEO|nr:uncharacterized protein BU26DRAFT_512895 [Trematosphaeria pertusa]KAF2255965.1 hypothetical protein BU26DRAFT_512895 [Trematosphaeria pertusa]
MAITEMALLHLSEGTTADDASLRSKLTKAKTVMQTYTGRTFYIMQQIEDPSFLYVIGEWESLDQHMNGFIPSADNQALLESLKDELAVDWLLHIDAPHTALPLPKTDAEKEKALKGELIYSIGRHFIKTGEKDKFQETFDANKKYPMEYVTEGSIGYGWRVDKEEHNEEFVLWGPWKSVDQHLGFAKTEGFAKYAKIRDHLDGADIKHAKIMDV